MSDDLRTRIAAVQRAHREELCEENVCICGHHGDYPNHVADAVIRELSLMIDDSYRISYGNAFIVHGYYEVRDSR